MTNQIKKSKKIAIIGTGISGLSTAFMLNPHNDITLYEKNDYIGGHARTIDIKTADDESCAVDTGFIVFNKKNYPLLTALFEHLSVPIVKSDMSFGVSVNQGWLEYGTIDACNFFCQKANWFRPAFWKMLIDILRFNRQAKKFINAGSSMTLGQLLTHLKMGKWFQDYFLLAMGAAIWSTPVQGMLEFPAQTFLRFFDNHGLLTLFDHPQWYTVKGGSREYVKRLSEPFKDKILLSTGVTKVIRTSECVMIYDEKGECKRYDEVVFACHSDQALKMIQPTADEQEILGNITYQPNLMMAHSDLDFMPKLKKSWSSWVYLSEKKKDNSQGVSLSYWMNNLQPLNIATAIIVTLNPFRNPKKELLYDSYNFEHPVFDKKAIIAQKSIHSLQGLNRSWFCGAYQRYGFHEDGLMSAVEMVRKMGITPTWGK